MSAACGIPPAFSTEAADLYIGYCENRDGEQWIFTFDRGTRQATLRGGDVDWGAHLVHDGRVDGLILAPEEAAWLHACWSARSRIPDGDGGRARLAEVPTRSRVGPPDLDQSRDLLAGLACNDVEPQVRPVEGRDEQERIAEPELPGDVVTYRRAMSGEERRRP